jgi:glycosyltransferase involved in cell wall biosynthesis
MKSLLFLSPLYAEEHGGAEISTRILFEELLKKGFDVKIASLNSISGNPKILKIPYSNLIPKKFIIPTTAITDKVLELGLKKLIQKQKPDLIHIQDMSIVNAGVKVSEKFNIPVIITVRDYRFISNVVDFDDGRELSVPTDDEYKDYIKKMMKKRKYPFFLFPLIYLIFKDRNKIILDSIKKCDRIISISHFIKNLLINNQVDKNKISVVHTFTNPLDKCLIKKSSKEIIIFSPGRLVEAKGFDWLIKSFSLALKSNKNIKLIIAGKGPLENELKNLADNLGISDNVEFIGKINFGEMSKYYSISDFVVVPSLWPEPLGRVAFEAFSLKKPVIASNTGGIPEIVSNKEGILVETGNIKELADKIILLSKNKELREKFGKAGYKKFIDIENVENGVSNHIKIYDGLIKK